MEGVDLVTVILDVTAVLTEEEMDLNLCCNQFRLIHESGRSINAGA
jgi:hypothetical protein